MANNSGEEPRDSVKATAAVWARPSEPGSDKAMAGSGVALPARSSDDIVELRAATGTALEQIQDVTELLANVTQVLQDAHTARAGALAQVAVAVNSLRKTADKLEQLLTQPGTGHPRPAPSGGSGR